MSKSYNPRNDIEKSWLVQGAEFDKYDIPIIRTATTLPTSLLPFSKCIKSNSFLNTVHFYENDERFVRILHDPHRYAPILRRFAGIISPDFSICPDDPVLLQGANKYWNHALAHWFSTQGIPVIPNVRWGDESSFPFCFSGIEKNGVVAVGTHGQLNASINRDLFVNGLSAMVSELSPHTVIVYGKVPAEIFGQYVAAGIKLVHFSSETEEYYKRRKDVA